MINEEKEKLFMEVSKMESEINEKDNPIQANPAQPRNPNFKVKGADDVPKDKKPADLMVEIEALEKKIEAVAKPHLAPVRKPKKSDNIESEDGKKIMDEIEEMGKRMNEPVETQIEEPLPITPPEQPDNSVKPEMPDEKKGVEEQIAEIEVPKDDEKKDKEEGTVKEYLKKNKAFQQQIMR